MGLWMLQAMKARIERWRDREREREREIQGVVVNAVEDQFGEFCLLLSVVAVLQKIGNLMKAPMLQAQ